MRRAIRAAVVAVVWVPLLVVGGFALGGPEDFSGFEMAAKGTAVLFTFDSPSLGVPAKPTGELNFAYSESVLRSGPSAYGLGSIVWPGQVVAGLPPFIQSEIESESGGQFDFPLDVPAYPVRAESFHPQGPGRASTDAGTMHMSSVAKESTAEGVAYMNRFGFPAIGNMGNQSSMSSSGFDPDGVVAMAEAAANDIVLFGGLLKFDSVVSRLTARSDGVKGTVAGTTTVTGGEVSGTAVRIDSSGVHIADQGIDTVATQQAVNQALASAGISIELSKPVDTIEGPKATRALGGLLIRAKSSTLEPLIAALPAELQNEIRGQVTPDQEFTVQLAPAAVTAGAAKTIEFPIDLPDVAEPSDGGTTAPGEDTGAGAGTAGGPSASGAAPGGGAPVAITTVQTTFEGVPIWLVVLLMIAALVSSRPLTAAADRLLAARAGAGGCPEERD